MCPVVSIHKHHGRGLIHGNTGKPGHLDTVSFSVPPPSHTHTHTHTEYPSPEPPAQHVETWAAGRVTHRWGGRDHSRSQPHASSCCKVPALETCRRNHHDPCLLETWCVPAMSPLLIATPFTIQSDTVCLLPAWEAETCCQQPPSSHLVGGRVRT